MRRAGAVGAVGSCPLPLIQISLFDNDGLKDDLLVSDSFEIPDDGIKLYHGEKITAYIGNIRILSKKRLNLFLHLLQSKWIFLESKHWMLFLHKRKGCLDWGMMWRERMRRSRRMNDKIFLISTYIKYIDMAAVAVMSVGSSKTIIMKKDQFMKKYTRTIAPRRSSGSSGSSGVLRGLRGVRQVMMRITLFLNEVLIFRRCALSKLIGIG